MNKEDLIKSGLRFSFERSNPRFLKFFKNPELEKGFVFLEVKNQTVKLIGNNPVVDQSRLNHFYGFMSHVMAKYNLNVHFKFILNTHDEAYMGDFPVWGFTKHELGKSLCVVDPHLLQYLKASRIKDNQKFADKIDKFVFRGSDTGAYPNLKNNERFYIANAIKKDDRFNVKVSNLVRYDKDSIEYFGVKAEDVVGAPMTKEQQLEYKYILDINGNTAAWDRNCWVMGTNSVLIKIATKPSAEKLWYSNYMYDNQIVPIVKVKQIIADSYERHLAPQKDFANLLLDNNTQEEFLKQFIIRYNAAYNS